MDVHQFEKNIYVLELDLYLWPTSLSHRRNCSAKLVLLSGSSQLEKDLPPRHLLRVPHQCIIMNQSVLRVEPLPTHLKKISVWLEKNISDPYCTGEGSAILLQFLLNTNSFLWYKPHANWLAVSVETLRVDGYR